MMDDGYWACLQTAALTASSRSCMLLIPITVGALVVSVLAAALVGAVVVGGGGDHVTPYPPEESALPFARTGRQ